MPQRTLVIVNPLGARGGAGRRWRRVQARVRQGLGGAEIEETRAPRDAGRLAGEAVRAGVTRLVVAGGDGTLNEVANGLLEAGLGSEAELGLLPLGTGCDFARGLGVPRDPEAALALLRRAEPREVDAGRLRCVADDGAPREHFFLNAVSLGVSPLALEFAARVPAVLGARAGFALGAAAALWRQRASRVELRVDGDLLADETLALAAVANGRRFGGGMLVAPEARLDDGLFDVVSARALAAPRLLPKLPKLYRGTHLSDPIVRFARGRRVEARAESGRVRIEADGELVGQLPAELELLPGALRVLGPPR